MTIRINNFTKVGHRALVNAYNAHPFIDITHTDYYTILQLVKVMITMENGDGSYNHVPHYTMP